MQEIKTLMIPVALTDDEKIEAGENLTEALMMLRKLEEKKNFEMSLFKRQIKACNLDIQRLTDMLHNGTEDREVQCEVVYHMPVMGMKTIMRLDTNEPFDEKDMTAADKKRADELMTQQTNDL
jgi:hypothetical protein